MSKTDPYKGIKFANRQAVIFNSSGKEIFNENVVFPDFYTDSAVKIISSKYLANSSKIKETSLRQMIDRVSDTITTWGKEAGYFSDDKEASKFNYNLKYYQINQYFAFNSPVYFNVGTSDTPTASACFIVDVADDMGSIANWYKTEAAIFKSGSGSGVNLSSIRSNKEKVAGGGFASGPISFLKASDIIASVIKSGGTFRRSAKMACLDISHPDIMEFISCKDKEEVKLRLLKANELKPNPGYELSDEVFFQNTNISIRLDDSFMKNVYSNKEFSTKEVLTGNVVNTYQARDMLMEISKHAWETGDPGVMYHDNTNNWNTVIGDGEIVASNPCAEFLFLNNSSCNLASINLKKIIDTSKRSFDYDTMKDLIDTIVTAMDILVDASHYPTDKITKNSKKYRPLGLGFTNLGALLMSLGFAYDSDEGRQIAAGLTAIMTGLGYARSKVLGEKNIPAFWIKKNADSMYRILRQHAEALKEYQGQIAAQEQLFDDIFSKADLVWEKLLEDDKPLKNAQISVIAPTGTISFLMDADTTGIEPDFSLIKYKRLSGNDGAMMKTVNNSLKQALSNLGYPDNEVHLIISELVNQNIAIENSKYVKPEHFAIFDTAMTFETGTRAIDYKGHVKMMAAVQPFISGAISKTINMPKDCTPEEVFDLYLYAWEQGLKSITIYRDGSKTEQVLTTKEKIDTIIKEKETRKKLPADRQGETHKFVINGQTEGYLTHNAFEDGTLGEFFVTISKDGSTLRGLVDAMATTSSIALQHGVPLSSLVDKMINRKFEPAGFTQNTDIRTCSSIIDYIFRLLGKRYLSESKQVELGLINLSKDAEKQTKPHVKEMSLSTDPCPSCGALLTRLGSCSNCVQCGFNSGACG